MSLVVLGLSHRTSPLDLLERASLGDAQTDVLRSVLHSSEHLTESIVVSTCNRIEVYADARTFHGAVDDMGDALAVASGVDRTDLADHLYVHYEDRAVAHTFSVACGLDSMAVGEGQILGQMRESLAVAQQTGTAGASLNSLFQHALRVGKKARTETAINKAGPSLVEGGLDLCAQAIGDLKRSRVLVVGAGAMSSLAATTLVRRGITDVVVLNRTDEKAEHLAAALELTSGHWGDLHKHLAAADLVVSCTGATDNIVDEALAAQLAAVRGGRPQAYLDLALPRDIAPEVANYATVVDLESVGESLSEEGSDSSAVADVEDLVTAEVADYLTLRRQAEVGPTVAALRRQSAEVVAAEMARLRSKLPDDLDPAVRREIEQTVHRVATKLLHTPTVRVKELATSTVSDYPGALRALFDLDPRDTVNVSAPPACGPKKPLPTRLTDELAEAASEPAVVHEVAR